MPQQQPASADHQLQRNPPTDITIRVCPGVRVPWRARRDAFPASIAGGGVAASEAPAGAPAGATIARPAAARGVRPGHPVSFPSGAPSAEPAGNDPHAVLVTQSVRRMRVRLLLLLCPPHPRMDHGTDGRRRRAVAQSLARLRGRHPGQALGAGGHVAYPRTSPARPHRAGHRARPSSLSARDSASALPAACWKPCSTTRACASGSSPNRRSSPGTSTSSPPCPIGTSCRSTCPSPQPTPSCCAGSRPGRRHPMPDSGARPAHRRGHQRRRAHPQQSCGYFGQLPGARRRAHGGGPGGRGTLGRRGGAPTRRRSAHRLPAASATGVPRSGRSL